MELFSFVRTIRMETSLVTSIVGSLIALAGIQILYRIHFHPLRKVPGPPLAKTTELWRTRRYFAGQWHQDIIRLHRQYGSVVRIAPSEVSVVDPELVNTVYSISQGTEKTGSYNTWLALGGMPIIIRFWPNYSIFTILNKDRHRTLRSRVANIYTLSSFVAMEDKVTRVYRDLFSSFDSLAQHGTEIDLAEWANFFTYDIVTCFSVGKDFGFVRAGSDYNGAIESIHLAFAMIASSANIWGQSNWYNNPLVTLCSRLFGKSKLSNAHAALTYFSSNEEVESRKRRGPNASGKQDMLDALLDIKSVTGKPLSTFELFVELGNPLVAGADTTAVAIAAVLGPLMQDKDRYRRLQREIDDVIQKTKSERESDVLCFNDVKDLPFLKACITEGMRMHPSITFQLPRKAPKDGINLGGYYIPPGSTISMSAVAQNRSKVIFGEDADDWRPERWLESDSETLRRMEKGLATFGYGTRACLGRNMATLTLYKLIGNLIARYNLRLTGPRERPWKSKSMWSTKIEQMFIKLEKRPAPS